MARHRVESIGTFRYTTRAARERSMGAVEG